MTPVAHSLSPDEPVGVRISELSRRVGVSTDLLRAWERRYRLLLPARSPKGYRLYTPQDELRIRAMQDQLAGGLSAAEAARVARGTTPTEPAYEPSAAESSAAQVDTGMSHYRALRRALDAYDESDAQHVLDTMLRELSLTTVLRDIVIPYLAEVGERWEAGRIDVAQEHFASNLLRGRLAGLALGWGQGLGPRAILACPEGELHDLPLMVFGIMLNRCGWRVTFLGNNTPVSNLESAVHDLEPQVVVLSATSPAPFAAETVGLRALATRVPVVLAGAGATPGVVAATGATALRGDPVTEALRLQAPRVPVTAGAGS